MPVLPSACWPAGSVWLPFWTVSGGAGKDALPQCGEAGFTCDVPGGTGLPAGGAQADEPDFDLYKLVPAPTNTPYDAGPYITLGMCYAAHPDTGAMM